MHEYTKSSVATIIVIANQYKMDSNAHLHRCQLYILQHNPNEATFHGDKAAIKLRLLQECLLQMIQYT